MSGPHQAPTGQQLRRNLTAEAERLNGTENLRAGDISFISVLTDIYNAAAQQNHGQGYPAADLIRDASLVINNIVEDWNERPQTTLTQSEADRLVRTTFNPSIDRALTP